MTEDELAEIRERDEKFGPRTQNPVGSALTGKPLTREQSEALTREGALLGSAAPEDLLNTTTRGGRMTEATGEGMTGARPQWPTAYSQTPVQRETLTRLRAETVALRSDLQAEREAKWEIRARLAAEEREVDRLRAEVVGANTALDNLRNGLVAEIDRSVAREAQLRGELSAEKRASAWLEAEVDRLRAQVAGAWEELPGRLLG